MGESVTPPAEPERWLPVVGYEGLYEVSDLGRVRSLDRAVQFGIGTRISRGRTLKLALAEGYFRVTLSRDNKVRHVKVHILVAAAFLGPRPEGLDVCHGPRGSADNRPENLSYGTRSKNTGEDRRRDGTINAGTRNPIAKLTEEIVRDCRARHAAGESANALGREFGIRGENMRLALIGRTWKHVPFGPAGAPAVEHRRGENHCDARLTEAAVADIRIVYAARSASAADLARIYGVTEGCVWQVIYRKTWKHVA